MKKLLLLMTLVICVLGASAQNTTRVVTGAVIDKTGNPIPNVKVEATSGSESVTTDADGTFSIEVPIWLKSLTATYPGLANKKVKLNSNSNYIFNMTPPRKEYWFLNFAYSAGSGALKSDDNGRIRDAGFNGFGVMGGYLGNWGGYAKVLLNVRGAEGSFCPPTVTIGAIKKMAKPLYLYLGAGYSTVFVTDEDYSYIDRHYNNNGAAFDIGAIMNFKRINFSIGYGFSTDFDGSSNNTLQLSVGYCFK